MIGKQSMLGHASFVILTVALVTAAIVPAPGQTTSPEQKPGGPSNQIRQILEAQQAAWNRGDIDAFMEAYWRSPATIFVSGDEITRGWQTVRNRYHEKYSTREKMGTLRFSELEIHTLTNDISVALGRWELERRGDKPHGHFTLIFRDTSDGWKIIHDHTSAAEKP